ncbi:MAG: TldD/PmbA family protein [Clostridiales bacterium]|nr:TldD/PmbA family protein [Clostridiales bacterium]
MENSFDIRMNEFARQALDAAKAAGISPAEATLSASESFSVRVRTQKLEDYKVSDRLHLVLRGVWQGKIGTASTQAMDEESLDMLIQGVKESAELIETDEQDAILPPDERYSAVCNYSEDVESISAEDKITLAMRIDARLAAKDARIKPDACVVASTSETFALLNTLGLDLSHRSNMIYAYASCLAKEGENAATGFRLLWGYSMEDVDALSVADGCAKDALDKLGAVRLSSGTRSVVIRNNAMADLLSTFCGVFSADNAQKGMSLLAGKEGESIASGCVTLVDDPLMPWGLGSCPFDREGAATMTKNLIENGTLKTLLHNRKTAKKAGVKTTGNAAGSGRVAPSNLYIRPGEASMDDLLAGMGDGLLITELSGLHAGANPISGDFSLLARGFEVIAGKCVRAVEQFTVAGNFYDLLRNVTAVGSDLLFEGSPIGSPSVAVAQLNIAGE